MRSFLVVVAAVAAFCGLAPLPAVAAETYQCESGPNAAIVSACGARWESANIRAHVAAQQFGGASASCLTKTAAELDDLASDILSSNKGRSFSGTWPCGKEPAVAKANDGVLAAVCPGKGWTYENKGSVACAMSRPRSPSAIGLSSPPANSVSDGPSYAETAQWLVDNVPILSNGTRTDNGARLRTTGFSVTDCIVSWQGEGTLTDGSTSPFLESIPFDKVTLISTADTVSALPFHVTMFGVIHQTQPEIKDWSSFAEIVSSADAANSVARALIRLQTLCRAKGSPF